MPKTEELRVCRACLGADGELHELKENGLVEKFQQVTSLRLCPSDGTPKHICSFCRALLLKAHLFRRKCLEMNTIILQNAGGLNCSGHVKKASMLYELSLTDILVVAFVGEQECAENIDKPDYHEVVVMEHNVAIKEEQAEIDNLQNVDGCFEDEPVKCNNQVISNDESHISNTSNHARNGVNELAMAIDPTTAIQTECNIKDELFEISPNDELDENFIETNDLHDVFNEEIKHNKDEDLFKKFEEDINGINESLSEETMQNTEVDILKKVKDDVNAIDIESNIKQFKINSKCKGSTILKRNTTKSLKCKATIIERRKYQKKAVHMAVDSDALPYICEQCGKPFKRLNCLTSHKRRVHIGRLFGCDICGKMYKDKDAIRTHIRSHNDSRPYPCEQCGKAFRSAQEVKAHQKRVHTVQRMSFACEICGKQFSSRSNIQTHLAVHSEARPYPCEQCNKAFKSAPDLKGHQKRVHTIQRQSFGCDICGKIFCSRSGLLRHIRGFHSEAPPYSCTQCGKAFGNSGHLKRHQQAHTYERPFGCDICGKMFRSSTYIKAHVATVHSETRPHPCGQCGFAFNSAPELKSHQRRFHMAADARPYTCEQCGKTFKLLALLNTHKRRVHAESQSFGCDDCGKAYRNKSYLQKHVRASHLKTKRI